MFTALFLKRTAERAVRGAALGFAAAWTVAGNGFDALTTADPYKGLVVGFVGSVLFSITGSQVGDSDSPSLVE